ncbi:MAG: hypothetical protein ACRCVX_12305 [Shewanella sp.]
MPVKYVNWIARDMLRAEPEARFVFGDNSRRIGFGGQAKEMRGEPNAIGVATKFAPGMAESDFFADGNLRAIATVIDDLCLLGRQLANDRTVYVPHDGLGTGLSQLPQRAPAIANLITAFFHACPGQACPWEFV